MTLRRTRGALALVLGLLALVAPAVTRAAPDFGADREAWNGVGYLLDTAEEARVQLTPASTLDLGVLVPGDLVVAIAPGRLPDAQELFRFVVGGGYLIAAVEGDAFAPLASAFGLRLHRVPIGPTTSEVPAPRVPTHASGERSPESFLFFNVDTVATNHPDAFTVIGSAARPVLSFPGEPSHLVVEVRTGAGAALFISDASVFLNQMLRRHYGNKQFAANAFRYFCQREPCEATLLTAESALTGTFDEDLARLGPLQRDIRRFVERLDAAIPEVLPRVGREAWPLGLLALLAATAPAWRRIARRREGMSPASPGPPSSTLPSPPLETALAFAARRGAADFGGLALGLVDHALDEARRARLRAGDGGAIVVGAMARLVADGERLRSRHSPGVSSEQFVRIQGDAEAILDYLRGAPSLRRASTRQEPAR